MRDIPFVTPNSKEKSKVRVRTINMTEKDISDTTRKRKKEDSVQPDNHDNKSKSSKQENNSKQSKDKSSDIPAVIVKSGKKI